jgi:hypothetical protein
MKKPPRVQNSWRVMITQQFSLFAALRQNRTQKIAYGRSFIFAPKAQK